MEQRLEMVETYKPPKRCCVRKYSQAEIQTTCQVKIKYYQLGQLVAKWLQLTSLTYLTHLTFLIRSLRAACAIGAFDTRPDTRFTI